MMKKFLVAVSLVLLFASVTAAQTPSPPSPSSPDSSSSISTGAIIGIAIGATLGLIFLFWLLAWSGLTEVCECCECDCCECDCCGGEMECCGQDVAGTFCCCCEAGEPCCECDYVGYQCWACFCPCCTPWAESETREDMDRRKKERLERRHNRHRHHQHHHHGRRRHHHGDGTESPAEGHVHSPVPVAQDRTYDDAQVIQFHDHRVPDGHLHTGPSNLANMPTQPMPTIEHAGGLTYSSSPPGVSSAASSVMIMDSNNNNNLYRYGYSNNNNNNNADDADAPQRMVRGADGGMRMVTSTVGTNNSSGNGLEQPPPISPNVAVNYGGQPV